MSVIQGAIVLGDISGYASFITTTELDHSHDILAELLETMTRGAAGRLRVAQIEGDAVFWLGETVDSELLDILRSVYVAFHHRLRDMQVVNSCSCRACTTAGGLSLKFVVHFGEYVRQRVGDADHFVGADSVVAHRLLKNSIPSREYVLLTAAALARLPAEVTRSYVRHQESYDVGTVSCAYADLGDLRQRARAYERDQVKPEDAQLRDSATFAVNREWLWSWLALDPRRFVWLAHPAYPDLHVQHFDTYPGARGDVLGRELHCHHGDSGGELTVARIVSRHEPNDVTLLLTGYGGEHYVTERFEGTGENTTNVEVLFQWDGELPPELDVLRASLQRELARVATRASEAAAV